MKKRRGIGLQSALREAESVNNSDLQTAQINSLYLRCAALSEESVTGTDTSGAFVTRQRLQEEYIRYGFSLLCYVSWITTDVASITMVVLACFLAHPYPKDYWCLGFCNNVWESLAYTVLHLFMYLTP